MERQALAPGIEGVRRGRIAHAMELLVHTRVDALNSLIGLLQYVENIRRACHNEANNKQGPKGPKEARREQGGQRSGDLQLG